MLKGFFFFLVNMFSFLFSSVMLTDNTCRRAFRLHRRARKVCHKDTEKANLHCSSQRIISLLHKDQEEAPINMDKTLANTHKHLWGRPGRSHPVHALVCCHPLRLDVLPWQQYGPTDKSLLSSLSSPLSPFFSF